MKGPAALSKFGKKGGTIGRRVGTVVTISLLVPEVWGSIPAPVKSVTESPTARHRCAIFSEFEAVVAQTRAAEMGPATRYMMEGNTASIMKV